MFKKIIRIIVFIPIAIILIVLSVANRQSVTLMFNPFETTDQIMSVSAPLFVFIFIVLMIGMVIGSVITWLHQGKHRRHMREANAQSEKWHLEADRQKEKAGNLAQQIPSPH